MSEFRTGTLSDRANRRIALTLEWSALAAQQNKAVKDATFGGWGEEEKAAYDKRGRPVAAPRAELFPLDGTERRII